MPMHLTGGVGSAANVTHYAQVHVRIPLQDVTLFFTTYAGFTVGLEAQGIGLLGQSGFFENFTVAFDHRSRTFDIDC